MMGYGHSEDHRPLFYVQGHPVYVTRLLVAVHLLTAVLSCVLMAANPEVLRYLVFIPAAMLKGWVWQFFTYAFVHVPNGGDSIGPSLLNLFFSLYVLWLAGHELEQHFGRKLFSLLYLALLLVAPILLTAGMLIFGGGGVFSSSGVLHLGIFVAFAAVYPGVGFFFGVPAKWCAVIAVAAYSLGHLAYKDWSGLVVLLATCGVALLMVRWMAAGGEFSPFGWVKSLLPRRSLRVLPSPVSAGKVRPRSRPRRVVEAGVSASTGGKVSASAGAGSSDVHESIDPLLEKISKHGLASLSAGERALLERARVSLLRKDRGA